VRVRAARAAGRVVVSASLATVLAACGGGPPAASAPQVKLPAADQAAAPTLPPVQVPEPDVPKYEPQGRRDPFETLEGAVGAGGGGSLVTTAKLTGIVRSTRATLALVETPEGIGYILRTGDTLGDGRLVEIGSDNVVFQVERPGESANRVVLRMAMN
jgi:Tfp pilus assembly protein PilP